ncbi:MAG: 50S ribosomal protein L29 [Deferribacteraceae bacterium]|nr:50S ribosomal protein L29 [Deferribacteraceae bacterium]
MKASELKELGTAELKKKENELREDILRLRFKLFTGELEDTNKIRSSRKTIARIQTILNQRNGDM